MTQTSTLKPCVGCGALVPDIDGATHKYIGAPAGCWAIFGEVLAKEFSDIAYFSVHQLTVDAYAVQHPGTPSRQSIQSVGVHLVSLFYQLERGFDSSQIIKIRKRLSTRSEGFVWLEPPGSPGAVTILNVVKAKDAVEHEGIVREWAWVAWRAWSSHHEVVRQWAML